MLPVIIFKWIAHYLLLCNPRWISEEYRCK